MQYVQGHLALLSFLDVVLFGAHGWAVLVIRLVPLPHQVKTQYLQV